MASVNVKVLVPSTALTAASNTGETVSLDNNDLDVVFELQASALDVATTLNVKVQHSIDKSVWHDLVSFTALVGASGNELKTPALSPLPNLRVVSTLAGTTKAATVQVKVASCSRR